MTENSTENTLHPLLAELRESTERQRLKEIIDVYQMAVDSSDEPSECVKALFDTELMREPDETRQNQD